ncbi:CoA-transferase [Boseongicola sp. H5]|uniref:acyl CoA:acetate/3-ketoacid CoA transferase n=1 Tax=Boseongicola sp. H5 TaxID=2763261 RepID=UPI001D09BDBE|nr:CoA-transferase [Boseongicola sp. H5]
MTEWPYPDKHLSARAAADLIAPGQSVFFSGSGGGHLVPEAVIIALAERFQDTGAPRDLCLGSVVSLGDWDSTGFGRLALPGLARRVISAGFNNCPPIAAQAVANEIEAYTLPQGVLSQLMREAAAGRPGLVTEIGLGTFVDPRLSGGKQSTRTTQDLVEVVQVGGRECLFYAAPKIDVAVIRGSTADEAGNITLEDEAIFGEVFAMACAARRNGGRVICQVKRMAQTGTLHPKAVKVPGVLVDNIVVVPDQMQTYQTGYNPGYAGALKVPTRDINALPHDVRKIIARRAAMELFPDAVVNIGFGVSIGITSIAAEEGFLDRICLTVEQGLFGGAPALGKDFGTGVNYAAMIDQPSQFDFYDGGGLDMAFLSFAQVDRHGNVNVSRYGKHITGPGGFINISQGTRKVTFSGTLTTGGLDIHPEAGGMKIASEGRVHKFVQDVEQITFSGDAARARGQDITYITDRAVFRLGADGLMLTEIAPGVDLDRDVRQQIGFEVAVADQIKTMDARVFNEGAMGWREAFLARGRDASEGADR